jgi:dynein heavy chain
MGKPGGGRQPISNRIASNFHMITYTQPDQMNMMRIYSTIATMKFSSFEEDIKTMAEPLARATIEIFKKIQQ